MVIEYETIMHKNVVWHTYEIHYSEFEKALDHFNDLLVNARLTISGPLFYALYNIPFDERMLIDIFIPVEQSYVSKESDLNFQSYLYIDEMLMTRVNNNFESNTEHAYDELFRYALSHDYKIISPIFHILRGDEKRQWVELKVKVLRTDEEIESIENGTESSISKLFQK
ncbi:DUF5085 family protein [Fictibacillus gelatini]|uniref:DUF5085 family protein n=1 Tax=Fictibacillus gelatini TaxID=225985 RepID=UPI000406DB75|nr:DUF5085 family protein [Fictibacillus gelatini]